MMTTPGEYFIARGPLRRGEQLLHLARERNPEAVLCPVPAASIDRVGKVTATPLDWCSLLGNRRFCKSCLRAAQSARRRRNLVQLGRNRLRRDLDIAIKAAGKGRP